MEQEKEEKGVGEKKKVSKSVQCDRAVNFFSFSSILLQLCSLFIYFTLIKKKKEEGEILTESPITYERKRTRISNMVKYSKNCNHIPRPK
jgi:hypothetical protein